jgi:hypothetical protein
MHVQVHTEFEALKAKDKSALAEHAHLFPELDQKSLSSILWLPFYQARMKDLVKNASEEELAAIAEHIKNRHDKELTTHERPWNAFSESVNDSEPTRKRNYLKR